MQSSSPTMAPANPLVQALTGLAQPSSPVAPRFSTGETNPLPEASTIQAAERVAQSDRPPERGSFVDIKT